MCDGVGAPPRLSRSALRILLLSFSGSAVVAATKPQAVNIIWGSFILTVQSNCNKVGLLSLHVCCVLFVKLLALGRGVRARKCLSKILIPTYVVFAFERLNRFE